MPKQRPYRMKLDQSEYLGGNASGATKLIYADCMREAFQLLEHRLVRYSLIVKRFPGT